jgi:hypothetical protein
VALVKIGISFQWIGGFVVGMGIAAAFVGTPPTWSLMLAAMASIALPLASYHAGVGAKRASREFGSHFWWPFLSVILAVLAGALAGFALAVSNGWVPRPDASVAVALSFIGSLIVAFGRWLAENPIT